jgi:glycerophosphoryl diester phosphodiesterase
MVELDVRVTRDGVPMIFHDADLFAATGRKGAFGDLTEAEVLALRFRKNDEALATLEQALVLCRQLHLGVMLDLKDPPRAEVLQRIAALVRKHALAKSTVTISGHPLVRAELGEVALVPVNAEEIKQAAAGALAPGALAGRYWFGIPGADPVRDDPAASASRGAGVSRDQSVPLPERSRTGPGPARRAGAHGARSGGVSDRLGVSGFL